MLPDQDKNPDNTPRKHDHKRNQELNSQFALYIVGCLALTGAIKYDHKAPEWENSSTIMGAIRVVKACLDQLDENQNLDFPDLPFAW